MSVFSNPAEHAANSPETWIVVKVDSRSWHLRTVDGTTLDYFARKRDALEAKSSGWLRRLYDQETRWYSGEAVNGWKQYQPAQLIN